jgi:hypothetical protein
LTDIIGIFVVLALVLVLIRLLFLRRGAGACPGALELRLLLLSGNSIQNLLCLTKRVKD